MRRPILTATSAVCLIALALWAVWIVAEAWAEPATSVSPISNAGYSRLSVTQFSDLNYKTKAEIYEMRHQAVTEHRDLLKQVTGRDSYAPSNEVFGQIQDKKTWWGLLGLSYYGPGTHSIDGPSRESLFVRNPYLLIGLSEEYAHPLNGNGTPQIVFPQLEELSWSPRRPEGWARYNVSDYFLRGNDLGFPEARDRIFNLHAYNARDLGYAYFYLDPASSIQVTWPNSPSSPVDLRQYIHTGGSSGYPGGSNNMSPTDPRLYTQVGRLPARASYKLWRSPPANVASHPDAWFVLEMH